MSEIVQRLLDLESRSQPLDPDAADRARLSAQVFTAAEEFLSTIETDRAYNKSETNGIGLYDSPIEEGPMPMKEALDLVETHVHGPGLNPASGGHLAYIPGGGLYASALGDFLAAVGNRYAGVFFGGPGAVRMENMLVRWLADLVGYPDSAQGSLLSGGSIANLSCIVTARDAMGILSADVPKAVIYLTEQVHHCVTKALRIAGLGECILRMVPVDDRFRMDPAALQKQIQADKAENLKPFLIVASAGTTDTGAVDPLNAIADVAEAESLWYHVDAAYGGFFMLSETAKSMLDGIERSDSVVVDPHKGLFVPYGSGVAIVKDGQRLFESHKYTANYMQDALKVVEELSPADLSPELTRHFRGLRMWLPLKLHGLAAFRAAAEEKLWLARYFWEELPNLPHVERGPFPDLSVVLYRFVPSGWDPNEFNDQLTSRLHADGRVFLSSTRINGDFFLRMVVLSFRSHKRTIDLCLQMLKENVEALVAEGNVEKT
jgi:aromatic-L-amino-acid decarboxylase